MKAIRALLLGAVVTGLVSAAHAQSQTPGWYVGPEAGWSHLQDLKGTADTNYEEYTGSHPITIHPSEGFAAGVTVGYSGVYLPNLRAEGEIVYRSHGLSSASTPAVMILEAAPLFISGPLTGSIDSLALMGNVYYDFMPESRWTPYLGAGIGAARLTVGDAASTTPLPPGRFNATDWQFAYQGIAGVKYQASQKWSLSLDYRYFATTDPTFSHTFNYGVPATVTIKTNYHTHNVLLGVAYHFGASPPPPPQPVPAAQPAPTPPPPPKLFVVYFDFDKSNLTPDGANIVQEAADTFKRTGSARIMVTGYTDLTGTQQYNLGLSKRRADTVKTALLKDGVPANAVVEAWRGKENPAVPTADGVREARNRRVEIVLP